MSGPSAVRQFRHYLPVFPYYAGGRISISWFDGRHEDFVDASKRIAAHGTSRLKHQIGSPVVTINGHRAISETNVIIMVRARTGAGEIDTSSYARFYDWLVKVNGVWKFAERVGVYEKDRIDPVSSAQGPKGTPTI
ncbi:MAG: nuclear transport factor 2 family protein [Pseudohongiellaceae bacterium]